MAKVKLVLPSQMALRTDAPPGERSHGHVEIREGVGDAFPLRAGFRHMSAGSAIEWNEVGSGQIVYLWEGEARVGETVLEERSCVILEHGSSTSIEAQADNTTLLVFDAGRCAPSARAAGGHVHLLPAQRVQRTHECMPGTAVGAAIYADAACSTCSLWLHENTYHLPHYKLGLHSHSQDEIIVVTGGEMVIGRRTCGRGAMLAVARDVLYAFETGESGMQFINFRPSHPTFTSADGSQVIDEGAFYRNVFKAPPPYIEF